MMSRVQRLSTADRGRRALLRSQRWSVALVSSSLALVFGVLGGSAVFASPGAGTLSEAEALEAAATEAPTTDPAPSPDVAAPAPVTTPTRPTQPVVPTAPQRQPVTVVPRVEHQQSFSVSEYEGDTDDVGVEEESHDDDDDD